MNWQYKPSFLALSVILLSACASQPAHNERVAELESVPSAWQQLPADDKVLAVQDNWLQQLHDPQVFNLVEQALAHNQAILQAGFDVAIKEQQLIAAGADLWPSLDLSTRASRSKDNRPVSYSNASSASLELSYEVDLWGKLSASERQANLEYLAEKAIFAQSKQQLVADVVAGWFDVITNHKLLELFKQREQNAEKNLDIIESGYRQGLNEALDVYLARNELNTERSNIAAQQAKLTQSIRDLERLTGQYPAGALTVSADLPLLENTIPLGLPSELITRKPALMASWYQLLSTDAGLAYAHKQRFPSLNLSASISDSTNRVSDLFSPSSLAWSLIGSISMPLFEGGRLQANEEQARLTVKRQEQAYLATLYDAFNDVETAISQEQALKVRYEKTLEAQENAVAAERLSFEQYQSGLVTYTTVLDAQDRSFNAQSSVIELKNQLIKNRINLHIALGGDFSAANSEVEEQ
ncbi:MULTISPECIES: efflux transporter outer membrane subunit [unclassified Pseudoalteromonas]|uniref:efflux transporter outer membrane subunit n=1 Tax=unclassified Pseudoalteromonas TaxID=194690 RepID=UPI000C8CCDDE|nr:MULTISPECIES: efflux transporter outer membrane subunit [unclassified Pseudoalteromonas]QLE10095.1 efflux transporter outer membrane subunit [Pseudoalteromonas shioyasakiensis]MAD05743.1 RND transporter [Pseudoalteromonas sp.]MCG9707751.1 efflux transporter outer membrane subunit [Pseudoalteromonas sp. Isolate3]NIZ05496.1 efflux transporter outer membrane subunit [Pseudoalteromonas sp. HF66]RZD22080.1 efflux transporter outer membrane subunit [Pseudoalteromonas sp. MEBiC 03485]|tara:strand:+ start:136 stop:1542 length:1407 start_codon:yes stop_codon:yes gene_type:complete